MNALSISAVKIAANRPAKSSASSVTIRTTLRSVSARRRNESSGGRLRRTSTGVSGYDWSTTECPFEDVRVLGFVGVVVFATVYAPVP
jgi:hypothetical protein